MRESDLPSVMAIERRSYRYPWTAWFMREVLREGASCWVAEDGRGTIAGYGLLRVSRRGAHILNLCVAPERRREGLGRDLLSRLMKEARKQGAAYAWLEVRPTNRRAIALYEAAGFERHSTRRGYYPSPRGKQNAWVMAQRLDS